MDTGAPASRGAAQRTQRLYLLGAAVVLGAFAFVQFRLLDAQRHPQARLDALRPVVGAQQLDTAFDPAQHDRELEAAPGSAKPTRKLSEFAGSVLFLNFWATWCEPCVRELPSMFRLARALKGRKFQMVAVSYDESWADITKFFQSALGEMPKEILVLRDPDQKADPLKKRYGTDKLPESYIVANGRIADRFVNAHDWASPEKLEYFELFFASQKR
jgi:thiol-disulfide isomerase/thioredoxin